jgi:hypothetical protein
MWNSTSAGTARPIGYGSTWQGPRRRRHRGGRDRSGNRRSRLEREIAGGLLGRDLDMGVGGDQFLRNRNPLDDLDALPDQRVISRCSLRPSPPRSKPF